MAFEMSCAMRKMTISKLICLHIFLLVVFGSPTVVCQTITSSLGNTVSLSTLISERTSSTFASGQSAIVHSLSSHWPSSTSSLLLQGTKSNYSTTATVKTMASLEATASLETMVSSKATTSLGTKTSLEAASLKTITTMGGFSSESSIPNSYTTAVFASYESSRTMNEAISTTTTMKVSLDMFTPTNVATMSTLHSSNNPSASGSTVILSTTNVKSSTIFISAIIHSSGITPGTSPSDTNIVKPSPTTTRMFTASSDSTELLSFSKIFSPVSSTDSIEPSAISPISQLLQPSDSSNRTVQSITTAAHSDSATMSSLYSFVVTSLNRSSVTETGISSLGFESKSMNFSVPFSKVDTSTINKTRYEMTQNQSALEASSPISLSSSTITQTTLSYQISSSIQISSSLILPSSTSVFSTSAERTSESSLSSSEVPNNVSTASLSTESQPIQSTVNSTGYIWSSATFLPKTSSSDVSQRPSPTLNPSVVPTTDPKSNGNDEDKLIAIVAGSASGALLLFVLIGCICLCRRNTRDDGKGSPGLEDGKEGSNDLREHWNTLRGRANFRKSVMDLPDDMYSETNEGFELDKLKDSTDTLMSVAPSDETAQDETAQDETRNDDNGNIGVKYGTFKRDAGKSKKSSESLIALINGNDDIEPAVPNASNTEMKSFKQDEESTEKPVQKLEQSSIPEEATTDASSKEEELPDPASIPPPILDGEKMGASPTENAVVAPKITDETRNDIENPTLQQETEESENKRLSEYYF